MTQAACRLEQTLEPAEIRELDAILADPGRWPKTVWGIFKKPRAMTPNARRFGQTEMGLAWLHDHGHPDIERIEVLRHVKAHVPVLRINSIDELGMIVVQDEKRTPGAAVMPTGVAAIAAFYEKALRLGTRSLELLEQRIAEDLAAERVPDPNLLLAAAELGSKMAVSAATLAVRGASPLGREEDVWEGARPRTGPRLGHGRQHEIDGEARIVHDEGPADRDAYAERAKTEGRESPW